jgi:hypothetical protein
MHQPLEAPHFSWSAGARHQGVSVYQVTRGGRGLQEGGRRRPGPTSTSTQARDTCAHGLRLQQWCRMMLSVPDTYSSDYPSRPPGPLQAPSFLGQLMRAMRECRPPADQGVGASGGGQAAAPVPHLPRLASSRKHQTPREHPRDICCRTPGKA